LSSISKSTGPKIILTFDIYSKKWISGTDSKWMKYYGKPLLKASGETPSYGIESNSNTGEIIETILKDNKLRLTEFEAIGKSSKIKKPVAYLIVAEKLKTSLSE